MPQFPGNVNQFLSKNIQYPDEAVANGISGKVVIGFVVDSTGYLDSVYVRESVHTSLDKEALRVVRLMPRWIPGKQGNKPVRIYYSLPITFRFSDEPLSKPNVDSTDPAAKRRLQDSLANNYGPAFQQSWSQYLARNLKYPKEARKQKITGRVRVQFLVQADGTVTNVEIEESAHPILDQEALRVAKQMAKSRWRPGKINGQFARYYLVIPFYFPVEGAYQ
ncbi:energy transducer TonB [Polluticoccus soli]|uniref:energy transducer TonB n=1 Tax=Polluticoccus soli TaxID=3034150 RepID=UPI0023E0AA63|nr:energy transducer TonB [Flavipsychrobacter sp. JY13-12]